MTGAPSDGELRLNEVWTRLDRLCADLWREDRRCAVGLQALVEEFRAEVDRAEKTVESLRLSLAVQKKTIEVEVYAVYEARVCALNEQLADIRRSAQGIEDSLTRERGKNSELQKALEARDAEIAALNESHLKTEADRNLQVAEKARALRSELKEKELRLEAEWERRRHLLETECEARLAQSQKTQAGDVQALKTRMRELYRDYVRKEDSLDTVQKALGRELESVIQEYQSKKDQ